MHTAGDQSCTQLENTVIHTAEEHSHTHSWRAQSYIDHRAGEKTVIHTDIEHSHTHSWRTQSYTQLENQLSETIGVYTMDYLQASE